MIVECRLWNSVHITLIHCPDVAEAPSSDCCLWWSLCAVILRTNIGAFVKCCSGVLGAPPAGRGSPFDFLAQHPALSLSGACTQVYLCMHRSICGCTCALCVQGQGQKACKASVECLFYVHAHAYCCDLQPCRKVQ